MCRAIAEDRSKAFDFTLKRNMVAVITNGTAVLGLGDIGAAAGMPVMEGKSMLFKEFGDVDSYPICIDSKDPEVLIKTIAAIAPAWGGINLEDIAAPVCFEVEDRLKEMLDIPVFHDDQHGTAIVVLAALLNSLKMTGEKIEDLKVVVSRRRRLGRRLLEDPDERRRQEHHRLRLEGRDLQGPHREHELHEGLVRREHQPGGHPGRPDRGRSRAPTSSSASPGPGTFSVEQLKTMAKDPIVFAMANPTPEIMPELAAPYVRVMATGRSDYPNQINNVLAFPGIFKGALACRATQISEGMKVAAAEAIADCISDDELNEDYIIPSVFNRNVAPTRGREGHRGRAGGGPRPPASRRWARTRTRCSPGAPGAEGSEPVSYDDDGERPLDPTTGWVREHLHRYVATDGENGHEWRGVPTLLLTTRGRRSGNLRRTPLIYGRAARTTSSSPRGAAGPTHPGWYLNLTAEPEVTIQVLADEMPARARTAEGDERERLWGEMAGIWPAYDEYQAKTERHIPVVVLETAGS